MEIYLVIYTVAMVTSVMVIEHYFPMHMCSNTCLCMQILIHKQLRESSKVVMDILKWYNIMLNLGIMLELA